MQIDTIYTRDNVAAAKGALARTAERLLASYPGCTEIVIARRGGRGRVEPGPTQIVYVASSGGKWSRSSETRRGLLVGPSQAEVDATRRSREHALAEAAARTAQQRSTWDTLCRRGFAFALLAEARGDHGTYDEARSVMVDALEESGCANARLELDALWQIDDWNAVDQRMGCPGQRFAAEMHAVGSR